MATPKPVKPLVTATLQFQKSTSGTHVFGNEDTAIRTLYLPKMIFAGQQPEDIELDVSITVRAK